MMRGVGRLVVAALSVATTVAPAGAATLPLTSKSFVQFKTCTLLPTVSTSAVEVESDIDDQATQAGNNFGTVATADARSKSTGNRRVYIRFDLTKCSPAAPATATIKVSTLKMYTLSMPTTCRTYDAFRVTSAWTETGITWSNQPFGTSINNPPNASRTTSLDIGSTGGCPNNAVNQYVSGWSVTSDVQSFISGSAPNFGWMIRDNVEGSNVARVSSFSTKDANIATQAPILTVTYTL